MFPVHWFGLSLQKGMGLSFEVSGDNMKYDKFYNIFITLLLIPLWISLLTKFIEQRPWLLYSAIGITTLLVLIVIVRNVYELVVIIDLCYKCHRRKIDIIVFKAQKKLQKIIAKTKNVSVIDYAAAQLREICQPEIYSGILNDLATKERNPAKKNILLILSKQSGGNL